MTRALTLALGLCGIILSSCVVENRKFDEELAAARESESPEATVNPATPSEPEAGVDTQCQEYCELVKPACGACPEGDDNCIPVGIAGPAKGYQSYLTPATCMATCALFPHTKEPKGNTVECRRARAQAALDVRELDVDCPGAGPGGDGDCGSNCENYCSLYEKICGEKDPLFPGFDVCLQRCAGLISDDFLDWYYHHDTNTVQCRIVHLTSGAVDPATHCPHAKLFPVEDGLNCSKHVDAEFTCDNYCNVMMATCTGELSEYDSRSDCLATCDKFESLGSKGYGSTGENSLGCRLYHANSSLGAPETHCIHAGAGGDGHCGKDNCESYCDLAAEACPTEFARDFGATAACLTQCGKLQGGGADKLKKEQDGADTMRCRLSAIVHTLGGKKECAAAFGQGAPCK